MIKKNRWKVPYPPKSCYQYNIFILRYWKGLIKIHPMAFNLKQNSNRSALEKTESIALPERLPYINGRIRRTTGWKNAWNQTRFVKEKSIGKLREFRYEVLEHPPYSPFLDLTFSYFQIEMIFRLKNISDQMYDMISAVDGK